MEHLVFKPLSFLITAIVFCSCEKVIDIDLNEASPKIVIEGNITDLPGPYAVRISRTVNYDERNSFPTVSGAAVILSDNAGNSETLTETTEPGIYTSNTMQGVPGRAYTLIITIDETIYSAVSTMPQPVVIDRLFVEELDGPHGGEKMIQAEYADPPGPNFYRFILFINGMDEEPSFIDDDRLQDGELITYPVFSSDPAQRPSIKKGNSVTVYLQTIDKGVYEYFRTLNQMSGASHGGSVSTANPQSNISNGALGYFNACTVRSKTIVVP